MSYGVVSRLLWVRWRTHGQGVFTESVGAVDCSDDTIVTASITELNSNEKPFMGAARMRVMNVVPRTNHCLVTCNVEWPHRLLIRISLLYHNP